MDSYAQAKFSRKCTFSDTPPGYLYPIIRASMAGDDPLINSFEQDVIPQDNLVQFMKTVLPGTTQGHLVRFVTIPATKPDDDSLDLLVSLKTFYEIFDLCQFSRALLGPLADGYVGLQRVSGALYLGTPSFVLIWHASSPSSYDGIYIPIRSVEICCDFLQIFHQHAKYLASQIAPAYIGALVEWEEVRILIHTSGQDFQDTFNSGSAPRSDASLAAAAESFQCLAKYRLSLHGYIERLDGLSAILVSLERYSNMPSFNNNLVLDLKDKIPLLQDQTKHERGRLTYNIMQANILTGLAQQMQQLRGR